MATIHELNNPIAVHTEHGSGKCIAWIDYGFDVNTCWKVRLDETGQVRNYYDDSILMYENRMNGEPKITIPENWKK